MKPSHLAAVASLALAACAPAGERSSTPRDDASPQVRDGDSPSMRHKFRVNPSPKRRYDIIMTLKDAPGPFGFVKFWAHYLAPDCMYWTSRFAGTTARPTRTVDVPVTKLDSNTYVGSVYLDAMMDEDYYGKGVCHWQLTEVAVALKATGAEEETGFAPDIPAKAVMVQGAVTKYFWNGYYPAADISNFAEFGDPNLDSVPAKNRDEFFVITLAAKEVQP